MNIKGGARALAHRTARWWLWLRAPRVAIRSGTTIVFSGTPARQTIILEVDNKEDPVKHG